jgi:arylsulfatase A-like enzyme
MAMSLPIRSMLFVLILTATVHAKPNIILVMTDDQGYGDLAAHGNPVIKTPNLDQFAKESTQITRFYAGPVCSPTRAGLMTGRYYYRTGIVDTYMGRSMMHTDEVTLPEMLKSAGYRTGLVGKWHLGDCYPMRPQDQGFEEVLTLRGGGIGQPSDPPGGEHYFDPILFRNGTATRYKGYVSDILTDAAIDFVSGKSTMPFFLYLTYNAPHTPLEIANDEVKPYRDGEWNLPSFPQVGFPIQGKFDRETTSKIYGMVTNIDRNFGRLMKKLDELNLTEETIVIFMTDNGPQQPRYNAGLRGLKGTVYEGGIRVPFYIRWPAKLARGAKVTHPAATIDVVPTLVAAAQASLPTDRKIDGMNLLPYLQDPKQSFPDRTIFTQWHRGDTPEVGRCYAAIEAKYKLLQPLGTAEGWQGKTATELYDLSTDPYEQQGISDKAPKEKMRLEKAYREWFAEMKATREFKRPRIILGSDAEPSTTLTRQDWRGANAGPEPGGLGRWECELTKPAKFTIHAEFEKAKGERQALLTLQGKTIETPLPSDQSQATWKGIELNSGAAEVFVQLAGQRRPVGPKYVEIIRE